MDPLRVLVIPDGARLDRLEQLLAESNVSRYALSAASELADGLELLRSERFDALLLCTDGLDEAPLAALAKARAEAPDIAVVFITPPEDETTALKAIQFGAHDYLLDDRLQGRLLDRAVRSAIERQRSLDELERRAVEWDSGAQLLGDEVSGVTARSFGVLPMREGMADVFDRLVEEYGQVLDHALERRAYRVERDVRGQLRAIADELGFMRAGPRDVVDIHSAAMKRKARNESNTRRVSAYTTESRYLLMELMGYLVSYYRRYSLGPRPFAGRSERTNRKEELS